MLQITQSIINSIDLEYNEVYSSFGKSYEFNHGDYSGEIWISIYNESYEDNGAHFDIFQSAQCCINIFDSNGNEITMIEYDGEYVTVYQIKEEIQNYFYEWNI